MAFKNFVHFEGFDVRGAKKHILHIVRLKSKAPGKPYVVEGPTDPIELAERLQAFADNSWKALRRKRKDTQILQEIVLSIPRGHGSLEQLAQWAVTLADEMGISERIILIHTDESHPHAHILFPRLKRWEKQDIYKLQKTALRTGQSLGLHVTAETRGRKRIPFRAYVAQKQEKLEQITPTQKSHPVKWATALAQTKRLPPSQLALLLRKAGYFVPLPRDDKSSLVMRTPWREDQNPSLSWFRDKNGHWRWKDHGTGEHGSIVDFFRRAEDLSYPLVGERLSRLLESFEKEELPTPPQIEVSEELGHVLPLHTEDWEGLSSSPSALEYWLTQHGFPPAVAQKLAEDEAVKNSVRIQKGGWLVMQYQFQDKAVGLTTRSPRGQKRDSGQKAVAIIPGSCPDVYVVEGIRDALALRFLLSLTEELTPTILVLGGCPSELGLKEIVRLAQEAKYAGGKVYLATDSDMVGESLAVSIGRILTRNGLSPTKDYVRATPRFGTDWFETLLKSLPREDQDQSPPPPPPPNASQPA